MMQELSHEDGIINEVSKSAGSQSRPITIRIRDLPCEENLAESVIHRIIQTNSQQIPEYSLTIVPACDREAEVAALVDFPDGLPDFLFSLQDNPQGSREIWDDGQLVTFDRHFEGFTQLSQLTSLIAADVIAICGIDGHAYGSWQSRGPWQSREAHPPMWLRDFLPKDFPACRVMTWGYSGKLASLDYAKIDDYATELLEGLNRIRTYIPQDRPIIFLCHSFGGIVLTRALLQANRDCNSDQSSAQLLKSLIGIMFFAVPHGGMDVEDMRQIMENNDHPRHSLINSIGNNSEQLETQRKDFNNFLFYHNRSSSCKVISFYETEQSPCLQRNESGAWIRSGILRMPLSRNKAILDLPSQMETCISIHENHSSIIKLNSRYHEAYGHVQHQLRALLYPRFGPASRKASGLDPDPRGSSRSSIISTTQLLGSSQVLLPICFLSAMATIVLVPSNNAADWFWNKRAWGLWAIAVPITIYTTGYMFVADDQTQADPRD